jgi:tetratricopeptide (TPR) repeat protein
MGEHQESLHATPTNALTNRLLALLNELTLPKVILLLALATCLAYANSLGGDFVYDDLPQIVDNPDIRSWDNLGKAFTTHVWQFHQTTGTMRDMNPAVYYRPLFTVLFTVEYHLFGLWPQGWHLVNLFLHLLCTLAVYFILLRLSHKPSIAIITATLFAVYPIHVESVSWISGVTDPFFSLFYLWSFYFYLKFREQKRLPHLLCSLTLFLLSAFVKEPALTLPVLIFLFSWIGVPKAPASDDAANLQEKVGFKRRLQVAVINCLPYAGVILIYLAVRAWALGGLAFRYHPANYQGPMIHNLWTVPWVVCTYVLHLLYPVNLSIAYNTSFITTPLSPRFLLSAAAILALAFSLFVYRKRIKTEAWYALALLAAPLVIVLNLRSLPVECLIADRYLYLSVIGWAYLIALGIEKLAARERHRAMQPPANFASLKTLGFASAILVVLVAVTTMATWREAKAWETSYTLYDQAIRVRPNYWIPYYYKGEVLLKAGRLQEAREAMSLAAQYSPQQPSTYTALGQVYSGLLQFDLAIENFQQAIKLEPEMVEAYHGLGSAFFNAGDFQQAEKYFKSAAALKPNATLILFHLGLTYNQQGRFAEAISELEKALTLAPKDVEIGYQLGRAYEEVGRKAEAMKLFQDILALNVSQDLRARAVNHLEKLKQTP